MIFADREREARGGKRDRFAWTAEFQRFTQSAERFRFCGCRWLIT